MSARGADALDAALAAIAAHPAADPVTRCEEAVSTRRSVRAFLPDPIPPVVIDHILATASRAPSGSNIQPWFVDVLTGTAKQRLSERVLAAFEADPQGRWDYEYYPNPIEDPYLSRRRKVGFGLYGTLGIDRKDMAARQRQHARNYIFFDAPVGLICSIEDHLETGSWVDYGTFIQNIMVTCRALGLHSCAMAAFAQFGDAVRAGLDLPDNRLIVCGIGIGFEDKAAPENSLRTEREPVGVFTRFHDG